MSNDQWAKRQGYSDFNAFTSDGNAFPNAVMLNAIRQDAKALIDELIGSAVTGTNFLLVIEKMAVDLMLDDNIDRLTTETAVATAIRNYIRQKDEPRLDSQDSTFNRGVTN